MTIGRWGRLTAAGVLLLGIGAGCSGNRLIIRIVQPPLIDDADYVIDSVTLSGPSTIANGSSATYTVVYSVMVRNNGGNVSPHVILLDQDDFLRFDDDTLTDTQHALLQNATTGRFRGTVSLSLSCVNNEVVGDIGGSGEGGKPVFFLPVDAAEVFARVERPGGGSQVNSNIINVECN